MRSGRADGLPRIVEGFVRAQTAATPRESAALVSRVPASRARRCRASTSRRRDVWEALLEDMPMTALIRNLATMTRVGVLAPHSVARAKVIAQLGDTERIRKARVHPIAVLAALRTYQSGRGARGKHRWNPLGGVVDALDAAFYASFGNVEPSGRRMLLALDVSGSMTWGQVAGIPGLTPRDASAALALVTAATEEEPEIVGFFAGRRALPEARSPVSRRL